MSISLSQLLTHFNKKKSTENDTDKISKPLNSDILQHFSDMIIDETYNWWEAIQFVLFKDKEKFTKSECKEYFGFDEDILTTFPNGNILKTISKAIGINIVILKQNNDTIIIKKTTHSPTVVLYDESAESNGQIYKPIVYNNSYPGWMPLCVVLQKLK
tara:strand:- start:4749 stop:5222 length:474 start_codon:yes stop_codon:yes gene_type:complete